MDRILIGTNDNIEYYPFIEIVNKAWKKFFPEAKLTIGYVSRTFKNFDFIKAHCDEIIKFEQLDGVPSQNISKVVRPLMAENFKNSICMFSDIDLIPLQKEYFYKASQNVTDTNLVCCGYDADCLQIAPDIGKTPICFMLGKGKTITEIINPKGLKYKQWINKWRGFKKYDTKEDISKLPFSDESLFRVMLYKWDNKGLNSSRIIKIKRGWVSNRANNRFDRTEWKNIDKEKLTSGNYIDSHMLKPYDPNNEQFKIINDFLEK